MLCETDDDALLPQGKEDNETMRKIYRKTALRLEGFDYILFLKLENISYLI